MSIILDASYRILPEARLQVETCSTLVPFEKAIETCFIILKKYWHRLSQVLIKNEFDSEEEEIHFFRNIKPVLIAGLEYYGLLYHFTLFYPPDVDKQKEFISREADRLEAFKREYADFYAYYTSGASNMDGEYFTRKAAQDVPHEIPPGPLQESFRIRTLYDHLVARLWALERYVVFIKNDSQPGC